MAKESNLQISLKVNVDTSNAASQIEAFLAKYKGQSINIGLNFNGEGSIDSIMGKANEASKELNETLNQTSKEAENITESFNETGETIDKIGGSFEGIEGRVGVIGTDIKDVGQAFSSLNKLQSEEYSIMNKLVTATGEYRDKLKDNLSSVRANKEAIESQLTSMGKMNEGVKQYNSYREAGEKLERNYQANLSKNSDTINSMKESMKEYVSSLDTGKEQINSFTQAINSISSDNIKEVKDSLQGIKESAESSATNIKDVSSLYSDMSKYQSEEYSIMTKLLTASGEYKNQLEVNLESVRASKEAIESELVSMGKMNESAKEYNSYREAGAKLEREYEASYSKTSDSIEAMKTSMHEYVDSVKLTNTEWENFHTAIENTGSSFNEVKEQLAQVKEQVSETAETSTQLNESLSSGTPVQTIGDITNSMSALSSVAKEGLSRCISSFADFEYQMSAVKAIATDGSISFEELRKQAEELGASTIYTSTQVAEGMTFLAMTGMDTKEIYDVIPDTLNLAIAGMMDLGSAADIASNIMTGFKLTSADMGHVCDILAKGAASSNTNVQQLGEAFKFAAPIAGSLGYSLEDCAVSLGLMGNAGIQSTQAGTYLRKMMTRLTDTIDLTTESGKKFHLETTKGDGTMREWGDIIDDLRNSFADLSDAEKVEVGQKLVGQQAMTGLLAITNTSSESYENLKDAIYNCNGAAEDMATTMQDNLHSKMELVKSAMDGFARKMGNALKPVMETVCDLLIKFFNALEGIPAPVLAAIGVVGGLVVALAAMGTTCLVIANAFKGLKLGFTLLSNGASLITGAFSALSPLVSLLFSPAGIWIAGIGAVIAATVLLVKHWGDVCNFFKKFVDNFKKEHPNITKGFDDFKNGCKNFGDGVKKAGENFKEFIHWEEVKKLFGDGLEGLKGQYEELFKWFGVVSDRFADGFSWDDFCKTAGEAFKGIGINFENTIKNLKKLGEGLVDIFVPTELTSGLQKSVKDIENQWGECIKWMKNKAKEFSDGISWEEIKTTAKEAFEGIDFNFEGVKKAFDDLWDGISQSFDFSWIYDKWDGFLQWLGSIDLVQYVVKAWNSFATWVGEKLNWWDNLIGDMLKPFITLGTDIGKALLEIGKTIAQTIDPWVQPFMDLGGKILGIVSSILESLWNELVTEVGIIKGYLDEFFGWIGDIAKSAWDWISKGFNDMVEGLKQTFDPLIQDFIEFGQRVAEGFSKAWDSVVDMAGIAWGKICDFFSPLAEWMDANVIQPAIENWNNFIDFFKTLGEACGKAWEEFCGNIEKWYGDTKESITKKWDEWKKGFLEKNGEAAKNFSEWVSKMPSDWQGCVEYIGKAWGDKCNEIGKKLNDTKEYLLNKWDDIKKGVSDKIAEAKNTVTDAWNRMKEPIEGLKTHAVNKWEEIKSGVSNKITEAKNTVIGAWNKMKEPIEGLKTYALNKWEEIKSGVSNKITEAKNTVTSAWNKIKEPIDKAISSANNFIGAIGRISVPSALNAIKNGFNKIVDSIKSAIDWIRNFNLTSVKEKTVSVIQNIKSKFLGDSLDELSVLGDMEALSLGVNASIDPYNDLEGVVSLSDEGFEALEAGVNALSGINMSNSNASNERTLNANLAPIKKLLEKLVDNTSKGVGATINNNINVDRVEKTADMDEVMNKIESRNNYNLRKLGII